MALKDTITEIEQDISDVTETLFAYTNTSLVPSSNDNGLSYERGKAKRGKILNTCVLYVDIRNSVALTTKHQSITMGKIYTAFTKAVIKAARFHKGHTRNIIGDRVMIVFPEENCFTNAVSCAITINYISEKILSKKFPAVAFKCGIGIDYGELKIIKVGIQRNGVEAAENKGLVWTGYPANRASRLTDMANKRIEESYYDVLYYPINIQPAFDPYNFLVKSPFPKIPQPFYSSTLYKREHNEVDFADCIRVHDDGTLYYVHGKMSSFKKNKRVVEFSPILISAEVMAGLQREAINTHLYKAGNWKEQNGNIKDIISKVYGSGITWLM
jgi:adenylate cyclase